MNELALARREALAAMTTCDEAEGSGLPSDTLVAMHFTVATFALELAARRYERGGAPLADDVAAGLAMVQRVLRRFERQSEG